MIYSNDLDFSFSGLKTAVLTKIKKIDKEITEKEKKIISLDFENSVTEVLLKKIKDAMFETKSNNLIIGGGVIANIHIKNSFKYFCEKEKYNLFLPKIGHSGDNALMIAIVTYYAIKNGLKINRNIIADGNFRLDQIKV